MPGDSFQTMVQEGKTLITPESQQNEKTETSFWGGQRDKNFQGRVQ